MWRDRILEAKKEKGITTKYMAEYARLSEKTVTRILRNQLSEPFIDNVIELGASVGLSPSEIFSETGVVVGGQDLVAMQAEVDRLTSDRDALAAEVESLKKENAALSAELDLVRLKLEHKDELVKHKDEIIRLMRQRV